MPEGVEVKIICEQLNSKTQGKKVTGLEILGGRFLKKAPDCLDEFKTSLSSQPQLQSVSCKGKFIWFTFSNGWYLFNTLGMTGSWSTETEKHSAFRLDLDDSSLYFTDPRRFGTIHFTNLVGHLNNKLKSLGPDFMSEPPTVEEFIQRFNKKKTLCELLMDQGVCCGVGNYIKAEALYRAKLSPLRPGNQCTKDELKLLLKSICNVMQESYRARGATLATYKNVDGEAGAFSSFLRVYKKQNDPDGNLVVAVETPDKRTTYWVPSIQR